MGYVAQNAARIARALLEIALSRKWSQATSSLLAICKAIESQFTKRSIKVRGYAAEPCSTLAERLWPWSHPLEQSNLSAELMYNINRWVEDMSIEDIVQETPASFGTLIHLNERLGGIAVSAAQQFPRVSIRHRLQPLSHDLLRVCLQISRNFVWSGKLHGHAQYFWLWLSDANDRDILQSSKFVLRQETVDVEIDFMVLLVTIPSKLHIRALSDIWLGSETTVEVDLSKLMLPAKAPPCRRLLQLPYQSTNLHKDLQNIIETRHSAFSTFEMQCMHSLFFSSANIMISAPLSNIRYQLLSVPLRCARQSDES